MDYDYYKASKLIFEHYFTEEKLVPINEKTSRTRIHWRLSVRLLAQPLQGSLVILKEGRELSVAILVVFLQPCPFFF